MSLRDCVEVWQSSASNEEPGNHPLAAFRITSRTSHPFGLVKLGPLELAACQLLGDHSESDPSLLLCDTARSNPIAAMHLMNRHKFLRCHCRVNAQTEREAQRDGSSLKPISYIRQTFGHEGQPSRLEQSVFGLRDAFVRRT